ncbi:tetratricopeptide repeat protein [Chroococcidiopsis sp. CCMEE 29]|uniref:tetratricopeptide repeat protein n=1 Tax=Chroococcidiopsis sp. CCMEE 29 TaxID=155894 RepID=UPI002020D666|nr:tetratricopeptide repeat protein [Chroococcidiopsis sp. CCMEE 29]
MTKRRLNQKELQGAASKGRVPAQNSFQVQLQGLLRQQKYRQALEEIKKARRANLEVEFTPLEAEIWSLRGQQEFQRRDFKQAETSFRQALELGLSGEAHYWIARCLLLQNRLDAAVDFIQNAFEQGSLAKDYAISYLKLLLLKGDTATVEQLLSKQAKQFNAAQIHWARGVLALKAEQADVALAAFQKIKRPLTPGDVPDAWVAYTQQALGNWEAASNILGLQVSQIGKFSLGAPKFLKQPSLQRLAVFQQVKTGEPPLSPSDLERADPASGEAMTALAILQLLERDDYHNAAHALLNLGHRPTRLPELTTLRPTLLMLAGQQALTQGEPQCAEVFWKPLLAEQAFNPQLAVNLLKALELNESDRERQRLSTQLLKWVEQDAKQQPQNWSDERLKLTLAHLHCRIADAWMSMNRYRTALGSLQQAERICPNSPEVIGRKGLVAATEEKYEEAVKLLTQALEEGCRYEEVYGTLLSCWDELDNPQAKQEARRRYGKHFGDLNPEAEVRFAPWLDALYTQSYLFFSRLVQAEEKPNPPLRACQIFVETVQSSPNSGGRVSLNQAQAKQQWDALLEELSGEQQLPTLQAIALSIQLFAKREKGIAALINHYALRLFNLGERYPQAREAHLVILAVKETNSKKLECPIRSYLDTVPQPGNTLAQIQLQVHRFGWSRALIPLIEEALKREPQNPLLLLARATTYPITMPQYEELKQQGFEIARRLQDAKALQAFREEQAFLTLRQAQAIMPEPKAFGNFDEDDTVGMLESMLRQILGQKIPPAELERMLPELKRQMLENMPDLAEDEDDDEFDFNAPFSFGKPKKRKRGFGRL